jgi:hypothetical protein
MQSLMLIDNPMLGGITVFISRLETLYNGEPS